MLKLAWRGVQHNPGRYVATLVAIVTGVSFFAAAGFLGDRVIDSLEGETRDAFGAVDVAVVEFQDPEDFSFADEFPLLAGEIAEQVVALPDVDGFALVSTGPMAVRAADDEIVGTGSTGRLWIEDDELNPLTLEEGRGPTTLDEIAIDRALAESSDLAVGDTVAALSLVGEVDATIVGVTAFGDSDSIDAGGTISIAPSANAWLSSSDEYEEVYLRSSLPQDELVDRVEPLLPDDFVAQPGDDFLDEKINTIGILGSILKSTLRAFAALALFVGGFVIYNTFNVLVAQRVRELAILRAVGATPAQVRAAMLFEGAVVGVIGSAIGTVVGAGLMFLLDAILTRFGVSLPGGGLSLRPSSIALPIVFGTIVASISVLIPARRAAATDPMAALRDAAAESVGLSTRRVATPIVLLAISVSLLFFTSNVVLVTLGVLGIFVAAVAAGPLIALLASRAVRPAATRVGLEARLAADNTGRNPSRTATTANALLIGVFLVTLVSVAGTSAKDFVVAELSDSTASDFAVTSDGGAVDSTLVDRLRDVDGVETVVEFRRELVPIGGQPVFVSAFDGVESLDFTDLALEDGDLGDPAPGEFVANPDLGLTVGDSVALDDARGASVTLEVSAVLLGGQDAGYVGSLLHPDDFATAFGDTESTAALVQVGAAGASESGDALDAIIDERPGLSLDRGNSLGQTVGSAIDVVINGVNGLLLMSVLVAVIGIVNTLTLSIVERRRELGLLRILGMLDRDVRRMVRIESVMVSVLGTVTGVALGLFCGWALLVTLRRNSDLDIALSWALGRLGVILVIGVVLGVAASLVPAFRSTRLDALDSIDAT